MGKQMIQEKNRKHEIDRTYETDRSHEIDRMHEINRSHEIESSHKTNRIHEIKIKRIYEKTEKEDGCRILVDRLWPRGIAKEKADIITWNKEIAPSEEIRKAFHQAKITFTEFERSYLEELNLSEEAWIQKKACKKRLLEENVTLVYASKNQSENNAVVLKKWITDSY